MNVVVFCFRGRDLEVVACNRSMIQAAAAKAVSVSVSVSAFLAENFKTVILFFDSKKLVIKLFYTFQRTGEGFLGGKDC